MFGIIFHQPVEIMNLNKKSDFKFSTTELVFFQYSVLERARRMVGVVSDVFGRGMRARPQAELGRVWHAKRAEVYSSAII